MFIKLSKKPKTFAERVVEGGSGKLYMEGQFEGTEHIVENNKFIFFADTNITKGDRSKLKRALDGVRRVDNKQLDRILKENYFLVIVEKENLTVHLLRDVCGVKTGYFSTAEGELYIGSVMHDVAKSSGNKTFDPVGVEQLICSGYLLDGQTLYRGVQELKAGSHMTFDTKLQPKELSREYVEMEDRDNVLSADENIKQLREEFKLAHSEYASPKNKVLLSGGLDSIAMAIALDDLNADNLTSISFKVRGTTQDETVYAKNIANHLNLPNKVIEIDPEVPQNIMKFEETILKMNNPYFGAWIFGNFKGDRNTMFFAGQDTRLHTPALNEVDKWAFLLLNRRDKFWMKKIAVPVADSVKSLFERMGWHKSSNKIVKNLYKLTHIFELKSYLQKFYLKLGKEKLKKQGLPVAHYKNYESHFDFDLDKIKTPRALYNKMVELKWGEQYIYDMRYLQDLARINGTYIAMPFYNKGLAEFSSGIPFKLSVKAMLGRARFGKKRAIVYKYVLRHALRDKLTDMCFYRSKAVSQTLHQLFNGAVGAKIKTYILNDLKRSDSFVEEYNLGEFVKRFTSTKNFALEDADYLSKIYYIGTLIVFHNEIVRREPVPDRTVRVNC